MGDRCGYIVFDANRRRVSLEFDAFSDEKAREEFSSWYNRIVRPSRWEARKFGRYWLYRECRVVGRDRQYLEKPVRLMCDDEVRLSYWMFRMSEPPNDDAEQAELDAEFERLDKLDRERLARRGNQAA